MKLYLFISVFLAFLVGYTNGLHAQIPSSAQNSEAIDPNLSAEEKKKIEDFQKQQAEALKKEAAKKSNTKPPKKVFKPTEEISEDRPVPFPVDI